MSNATLHWGACTEARFLRDFWQRKPLLLRQAFPGFQPLLSRAQLFALAADEDVESRLLQREGRRWQLDHGPFTRKQLPAVEKPNWTLLVQGVNLHVDAASELLRLFRFIPDARLDDLMISWASKGGGVGPHQDAYDVFLLQAAGRRRWRIGPVHDTTLQPGKPVKLLARFTPEEDLVLEPGDMLYLPPGWGHDGIAASGDCMTYSIGFRAPPQGELLKEVLWQLAEAQQGGEIYRDPPLRSHAAPALLPPAMVKFARDAFARLKPDAAWFENMLGIYLTTPKPQVWFEAAEANKSALRRACRQSGCRLDRRSKMLYTATSVFINGETVEMPLASSALLRTLADQQTLNVSQVQSASPAELALLADWCALGWLQVGVDVYGAAGKPAQGRHG